MNLYLQIQSCLDQIACNEEETFGTCYVCNYMCSITKLLHDCYKECLFPFELVYHLTQMVCLMERAFNFVFNDDDEMTWLLGEKKPIGHST